MPRPAPRAIAHTRAGLIVSNFRTVRFILASGWCVLALSVAGLIVLEHVKTGFAVSLNGLLIIIVAGTVAALLVLLGCVLAVVSSRGEAVPSGSSDKGLLGASILLLLVLATYLCVAGIPGMFLP